MATTTVDEREVFGAKPLVGQSVRRVEDSRLVRGQGKYVDDLKFPGQVYAAFVRSPVAHARIRTIDISRVQDLPGVVLVLTGAEVNQRTSPLPVLWQNPYSLNQANPLLAEGKVRYVGDPLAVVVAEDRYVLEDAVGLIAVDFEVLPAVLEIEDALREDAPLLYEDWGTNVVMATPPDQPFGSGDVEAAFREADRVISAQLYSHRHTGVPMETRGAVAVPEGGRLVVYTSTQAPNQVRTAIATCLRMGENEIRVIAPDVGGGFGVKTQAYPEECVIGQLARLLQRPVKWIESRREHLVASTHAREQRQQVELAVMADGTIKGLRVHLDGNVGAHYTSRGPVSLLITASMAPGPYRIPAAAFHVRAVVTNKSPDGPYRGFGGPEATGLIERMLDIAAHELGLDPAELRRRNLLATEEVASAPTATGVFYGSGDYATSFEEALTLIGYEQARQRQREMLGGERLLGIGVANVVEFTGLGPPWYMDLINFPVPANESSRCRVEPDGTATIYTGITPVGQGTVTALSQLAVDALGVKLADIRVVAGDTDAVYSGMSTAASRAMVVAGPPLVEVCQRLKAKIRTIAGHLLEASPEDVEVAQSRAYVRGSEAKALTFREIAAAAYLGARLPVGMAPELTESSIFAPTALEFSNATHVCLVEIERDTGAVEVKRYVVVHDCGRVVNPLLVEGQITGGVVQGLGGALSEELRYGPDGQLLTPTLSEYRLPRAHDVPPLGDFVVKHTDPAKITPSPTNPLGVKGVGEGGTIGATPAITCAVADALYAALGIRVTATPLTSERVWQLIASRTPVGGSA